MNLSEAGKLLEKLCMEEWVKIIHPGTAPATTAEMKRIYAEQNNTSHCSICLNLNGCCFVIDKCPTIPHHPHCHCFLKNVQHMTVMVECPIIKFTRYAFVHHEVGDKKQLFESWGFDINDSEYLQKEFAKQAYIAYSTGNYTLTNLNKYSQSINIEIILKRKDNGEYIAFKTGWTVYPDGKILLATPFANQKK